MASARENHSPVLVLGGRAPAFRWGQGSLQEIDHVPFVAPLVKRAATADSAAEIPELLERGDARLADAPHRPDVPRLPARPRVRGGPRARAVPAAPAAVARPRREAVELSRAAALLREAEQPVIMAGSGLYWGRGETQLQALAEQLRVPVFLNGLGRGCLPADHELFFSRARSVGLRRRRRRARDRGAARLPARRSAPRSAPSAS